MCANLSTPESVESVRMLRDATAGQPVLRPDRTEAGGGTGSDGDGAGGCQLGRAEDGEDVQGRSGEGVDRASKLAGVVGEGNRDLPALTRQQALALAPKLNGTSHTSRMLLGLQDEIRDGTFETQERIDGTVDRLLPEVTP